MENKYNLPESFQEKFEDIYLPKWIKNLGVMSDLHIPYHSIKAITEALDYFIIKRVDGILLNGDVIDALKLSKYQPDPLKRDFGEEIFAFMAVIRAIKDALPGVPIWYKLGNHEERYEKYMITHCPELLAIPHFEFESVLQCKELGLEVVKDQHVIYAGRCPIFHGHEVGLKSAAVNPARSLFLKIHADGLCSHLHRTSQHTEPSIHESIMTFSTGHLGDPHPKYASINRWNWGCLRVEKNEDGDFEVINVNLKDNKLFKAATNG